MKMKSEISVLYCVEVVVPSDFYEEHGHTKEYEEQGYRTNTLMECGGQYRRRRNSDVIEWGQSPKREECEAFIASWKEFLEKKEVV
jgi:hypothetical protein